MKILLFFYNLLFPVVLLVLLPAALLRMIKRGNYAHKFGQRFAWYSRRTLAILRRDRGAWIWIHAVSVGEVQIAKKFLRELRRRSDVPVLLSTTTSTGFRVANDRRDARTEVIYHPLDFLPVVARVICLVRPAALVLVEAEVWPNLTALVKRSGAPVMLLNARMSPRSHRRYQQFRPLVAPVFRLLDAVCVQTPGDVPRFISAGFLPDQLQVTGSVKFDPEGVVLPDASSAIECLRKAGFSDGAPVLLAASTHSGEELLLARCWQALRAEFPALRLILVPRHAERAPEICKELECAGFRALRRSQLTAQHAAGKSNDEILLVDTTGELMAFLQCAQVVFVGKSLLATGGQNPVEAILAQKPVLFGPHMENFAELAESLLANHGALCVHDSAELQAAVAKLLRDPQAAQEMSRRAFETLEFHRGATRRSVAVLRALPGRQRQQLSAKSCR